MKNIVWGVNVIGPNGINADNDVVIGSNDAGDKVQLKIGQKILNEDEIGQGGGTSDYKQLLNKPIVEADLEADGFLPVEGEYYLHKSISGGGSATPFVVGQTYDAIYWDTNKSIEEMNALLPGLVSTTLLVIGEIDFAVVSITYEGETDPIYAIAAAGGEAAVYRSAVGGGYTNVGWDSETIALINEEFPEDAEVSQVNNQPFMSATPFAEPSQFANNTIYHYVNGEYKNIDEGGTSDFDELENRPSYNGSVMTHSTNIPEVKTSDWDAKSTVSASATGTATDVVNYITINGVEKKLPTGGTGNVKSVNGYTPDATGNVTVPTGTPQEYDELVTDVATLKTGFNGLISHTTKVSDAGSAKGNVSTDFTIEPGKEYIVTNTGDTEIKVVKTYAPKSVAADEINKKVPVGESITFTAIKAAVKVMINCPTDDGGSWDISHIEKGEIDQKIDASEKNNKTFINVKNYGAKGDGVSNDRSAIQNALDYAESVGGGTVFFPKGTYCLVKTEASFAKAYVFIGNNTTLIFENGAVLKRNDHYTAHLLMGRNESTATGYDGAHNIIISGATFDCGGGDTSEWATGICLSHLDNALIENCVFKNGGGVGHYIECNSSRFVKIVNCDFQPDATSTMYLQIEAASGHGNGGVSDNTPSTDVIIDKCRFDIGTVGGTAISDEDTDDPTNNIRITNCTFHGNTTALGFIRFTAGVKSVDIYNNTFYAGSSQVSAVNIADPTQSCCIHDNRFNGFTTPIAGSVIKYNNIIDGALVQ